MDSLIVVGVVRNGEHLGCAVVDGLIILSGLANLSLLIVLTGLILRRLLTLLRRTRSSYRAVSIVHNRSLLLSLCITVTALTLRITVRTVLLRITVAVLPCGRNGRLRTAVLLLIIGAVLRLLTILLSGALCILTAALLNLMIGTVETFVIEVGGNGIGFAALEHILAHQFCNVIIEHSCDKEEDEQSDENQGCDQNELEKSDDDSAERGSFGFFIIFFILGLFFCFRFIGYSCRVGILDFREHRGQLGSSTEYGAVDVACRKIRFHIIIAEHFQISVGDGVFYAGGLEQVIIIFGGIAGIFGNHHNQDALNHFPFFEDTAGEIADGFISNVFNGADADGGSVFFPEGFIVLGDIADGSFGEEFCIIRDVVFLTGNGYSRKNGENRCGDGENQNQCGKGEFFE